VGVKAEDNRDAESVARSAAEGNPDDPSDGGVDEEGKSRFTRGKALGAGGSAFLGFALGGLGWPVAEAGAAGAAPGGLTAGHLAAIEQAELSYRDEIAGRRRVDVAPVVGEVKTSGPVPGLPGGGMIIACGHRQSALIQGMLQAAKSGDAAVAGSAFTAYLKVQPKSRKLPPAPSLARVKAWVKKVPVFVEFTYAGKLLAEGMVVTGKSPATATVLPFAGGRVQPDRFVAGLYGLSPTSAADITAVIVYRAPALTALEEKIVAAGPGDDFNQLVGGSERMGSLAVVGAMAAGALAANVVGPDVANAVYDVVYAYLNGAVVNPSPKDLNGGDLKPWLADPKHAALFEGVSPTAAVGTLLAVRQELLKANVLKL
jgi:hypothetical protein